MHFLRCPSCGAKALASASRCPRCTEPFDLLDGRGERMKLSPCRSCEVLLPENVQLCPWCKTERRKRSAGPFVAAAALLVACGVAWGYWSRSTSRAEVADRTEPSTPAVAVAPTPAPPPASPAMDSSSVLPSDGASQGGALPLPEGGAATLAQATPVAPPLESRTNPQEAQPPLPTARPLLVGRPTPPEAWHPATPTTWINVRTAASVEAPILRIVKPADAVQVGPAVAGWRPVRGVGFSGWAGARHFAVASTP